MFQFNPADFEPVRRLALEFPHASDSVSHSDTPSVKIKKNLLCRLHENGEWIVIRTDFESRALFLDKYPEACFITEHYIKYPYIAVYVNAYSFAMLKEILASGYQAIMKKGK
jgi:hypothetical protein